MRLRVVRLSKLVFLRPSLDNLFFANNHPSLFLRPSFSCITRAGRLGGVTLLWTIFVILLVLWLLGIVSSYTLGGFIHLLLVIALVVLLIQLISGRRPVL